MGSGCSRIVCCLMLLVALLCLTANARPRVDCTKFVYAPSCRGVAAKRGFLPADREQMYVPDVNTRKVSGLEQLLDMYATAAPLEEGPQVNPRRREPESWNALVEQVPKPDVLYDWYLNSLKRSKESAVYDY